MGIGEHLGDAIRNITGTVFSEGLISPNALYTDGVFSALPQTNIYAAAANTAGFTYYINMDVSRILPVASENRPGSVSLYYGIKY
jgi:hypothetical protein